jgi:hypothetical protein
MKVVMARPIGINLQAFALSLMRHVGAVRVPFSFLEVFSGDGGKEKGEEFFKAAFGDHLEAVSRPFRHVELNAISFWKELIQQVSLLRIEGFGPVESSTPSGAKANPALILERLLSFDPVSIDRIGGVCAIPLYELEESDFESFGRSATDEVREVLRQHHVLQYFFPPADQIVLAAADRGARAAPASVLRQVSLAPETGHPLAPNEIVDPRADLHDLVAALSERGLLVEGGATIEVTSSGHAIRAEVKFRPREGVMEKLSRILSIKLDMSLKDLLK